MRPSTLPLLPLTLLWLCSACAGENGGKVGSVSRDARDGGSELEPGDDESAGDGDGSGDGDDGITGDGDCAWADARPVAKSPVVWLALDQQSLNKNFLRADGTEEGTNGEALRPVLFGTNGIVSRMEHFVRFGLSAYVTTPSVSNCEKGTLIPAALDNAAAIAAAYETFFEAPPNIAPAPWASLEAIASAIAKQSDSFRNAVLLITQTVEGGLCLDEWGADGKPHTRAAVEALAKMGATVSVVTFLNAHATEWNPAAIARDAALAKAGGGSAFAGTDGEELIAAVQRFVEEGVSCQVTLEGKVKQGAECTGDVQLGDKKLACNDPNGFKRTDASTLELTGKACDELRSTSGLAVRARFPCDSFELF